MTGISLPLDDLLHSGACAAHGRRQRRARTRSADQKAHQIRVTKDYCLFDEQGQRLGTIAAARARPVLGTNAPTIHLIRELELQPIPSV